MRTSKRYLLLCLLLFVVISLYIFAFIIEPDGHPTRHENLEAHEMGRSSGEPALRWFDGENKGSPAGTVSMQTISQVNSHLELKQVRSTHKQVQLKELLYLRNDPTSFDFTKCRMSNCFDFGRCNHNGSMRVHILPSQERNQTTEPNISGESNIIHKKILDFIRHSDYYEPDASKACIFILNDDTLDRDPLSQSFSPYVRNIFNAESHYGMNHLIFNLYSGSWPDYREDDFAGLNVGAAILAKASNSLTHHRPNFDISIPLFSNTHGTINTNQVSNRTFNQTRPYLLTFKGKRYVIGSGSETRNSLHHLNNQNDVITLTTCRHGKKWRDTQDFRCAEDESTYNDYDFIDLMKGSTFCLTPRGRRLGSFRFLEALVHGCIPVVLSDGWTWPFDDLIDWSDAAIQFNENLVLLVPDLLRDISPDRVVKMRQKCQLLYNNYFSTIEKIVMTTLDIIEKRIKNHIFIQAQGIKH